MAFLMSTLFVQCLYEHVHVRLIKQENNLLTVNVLTRKASKANQILLQTHLVKQGNGQLLARLLH